MGLTAEIGTFLADMRQRPLPPETFATGARRFHRLRRCDDRRTGRAGEPHRCSECRGDRAQRPRPAGGYRCARCGACLRHGCACARLRRYGLERPSERGAGAGDPRRGFGDRRFRRADGARLYRRLRGLGRIDRPRQGPASSQGLASERHVRDDRGRSGVRRAARVRRRQGSDGGRRLGVDGRRGGCQFRHHDQAVPGRPRGAIGSSGGAACRSRLHCRARCVRAQARLPARDFAQPRRRYRRAPPRSGANGASWSTASTSSSIRFAMARTGFSTRCSTLFAANALAADDIAAVEAEMGETQAAILRNHRPQSALDAKFSAQFAHRRRGDRRSLRPERSLRCFRATARRAGILLPKVSVTPITGEERIDEPAHSPFDRVRVILRDNRAIASEPVIFRAGTSRTRSALDALWGKFCRLRRWCAARVPSGCSIGCKASTGWRRFPISKIEACET